MKYGGILRIGFSYCQVAAGPYGDKFRMARKFTGRGWPYVELPCRVIFLIFYEIACAIARDGPKVIMSGQVIAKRRHAPAKKDRQAIYARSTASLNNLILEAS